MAKLSPDDAQAVRWYERALRFVRDANDTGSDWELRHDFDNSTVAKLLQIIRKLAKAKNAHRR